MAPAHGRPMRAAPCARAAVLCALAAALCPLAMIPGALDAQVIRGVLLEATTSDPITGATIELLRSDSTVHVSATSDVRGWFHLEAGEAGMYLLRPSHATYTPAGLDTVSVGAHEVVNVILRMGLNVIPLEGLVVMARARDRLGRFFERVDEGGPGRFILRPYIERRPTARPSELLRMTSGIRVERNDEHSSTILMRGPGGYCMPQVFLDGLPVPQALGMSVDDFTAADLLEGIEIYDAYSLPPSELRVAMNGCGVIAFWSRRNALREFSWRQLGLGLVLGGLLYLLAR
jgi:hypothetical protein